MSIDTKKTEQIIKGIWNESVIDTLKEYIKIPNQSPAYDPEWATNGLQEKVVKLFTNWVKDQKVKNLELEVVKLEGRTPLIYMELPASKKDAPTVLMYGHFDKQPPLTEQWRKGLHPYKPVIEKVNGDNWLFGRGGADDGYAIFATTVAMKALQEQNIPHGRIVVLIEGCEESGSNDLPVYVTHLLKRIGTPNFIVCLDSGCYDYQTMWMTTSLRGILIADLEVQMLQEGIHSGTGSGLIADTFRIATNLIARLEDPKSGKVIDDLQVDIPKETVEQAKQCGELLKDILWKSHAPLKNSKPMSDNYTELVLNNAWRSTVTIVGAKGLPDMYTAGNVLRKETGFRLSIRLPPTLSPEKAKKIVKEKILKDPPYNAKVKLDVEDAAPGWCAPLLSDWVKKSISKRSKEFYGKEPQFQGEGGSIPFMGMLGELFPKAQFCVTGILGPESNAHGPNEGINLDYTMKLNCCIAGILADHANSE